MKFSRNVTCLAFIWVGHPGPGCARPPLCACVASCPGSGCSSAEIPEDLPPGQCRVVQELCAVVVLVRLCLKQNKTGGLCFAWMRGDSAVPGSLKEVPREVNVAGPPRGCRLCVHSLVGAPAVGMGCPLPKLLTGLLCTIFGRNDAKAETPVLGPPHAKS